MIRTALPLATLALVSPTMAQEPPADEIIGEWRISQAIFPVCQVITQLTERVVLTVVIGKAEQQTSILLESAVWNLPEASELQGEISWDDWETSQPTRFSANTLRGVMTLGTPLGAWPANDGEQPPRLSIRIPELLLDAEFSIGDGEHVSAAIADCLANGG